MRPISGNKIPLPTIRDNAATPAPASATASPAALSAPIDMPRAPTPGPQSPLAMPRWLPKPTAAVSTSCLRAVVAGKVLQRAQRALRQRGLPSDTLAQWVAQGRMDPDVHDTLMPMDRAYVLLCVGGDKAVERRLQALNDGKRSGLDGSERQVLQRVLAPFRALRLLLELDDAARDGSERTREEALARTLLLAWCADPAGTQDPAVVFKMCGFHPENKGWMQVQQRVAHADAALLAGFESHNGAWVADALRQALLTLHLAGFPDLA